MTGQISPFVRSCLFPGTPGDEIWFSPQVKPKKSPNRFCVFSFTRTWLLSGDKAFQRALQSYAGGWGGRGERGLRGVGCGGFREGEKLPGVYFLTFASRLFTL